MPYRLTARESKTIHDRLEMGANFNDRHLKKPYSRALRLFKGEHYPDLNRAVENTRIIINMVMHVIETRVHSVAFRYPRFVITPTNPEGEQREPIVQAALKYYWKAGGVQDELRRIDKDKEIYGLGVGLIGWLFETDEGTAVEDGEKPPGKVREDRFMVKRIFPGNFMVSPECGRKLAEAQWCGYWELVPLEEVKDNPHFTNTRQLKGNVGNLKNFLPRDLQEKLKKDEWPDDIKRVKLFHYYERRRQIHVIMCDEHEKPLYAEEWTWDTGRYPFRYVQGPGDEDTFYAQSMPIIIEHPQREINEARSQLSNHRRMAVPKYQCQGSALTDKAKEQIKGYDPLIIVEHNSEVPGAIVPIAQHNIQPEVYKTEEVALADITALSALSQYQLGNAPTKRTPTAEVNQIAGVGGARAQNDQQAFEVLCAEVATDCIAWLKKFAIRTRALPIYPRGTDVALWVNFDRNEIRGEYDIEVAAHSTSAPNDADTLQSIAFFLQSINPLIQLLPVAQQSGINLLPLMKQVLKSLPDIEDVDEILQGLNNQIPGPAGAGPASMPPGAGPAVMGPGGMGPAAAPALGPIPPELLQALATNGR